MYLFLPCNPHVATLDRQNKGSLYSKCLNLRGILSAIATCLKQEKPLSKLSALGIGFQF